VSEVDVNSPEFLHSLLGTTGLAVLVWELIDPQDPASMRLAYATPASRALTSREPEEVIGLTLREVFRTADSYPLLSHFSDVALGGPAQDLGDVEVPGSPDGSRTFSIKIFPMPGRRVTVVARDVTDQRQAAADVVDVLNSLSDAFFTYDDQWRYTFVNAAGERFAQTPKEEMLGKCVWDVFPEVVDTPVQAAMLRAVSERTTTYTEAQPAYADLWFSMWAYPTHNGAAAYMQDITELKRLEEQLQQAQKMDAVARLAGTIAHDFNNALTAIRASVALALDALADGEPRDDVARVDDIAAHAAALTEQLLTIARSQPLPASPTSVHDVVTQLSPLVNSLITEAISLEVDLDAGEDVALIDPSQLRQVILNLVLNARDAMPEGGTLQLSTSDLRVGDGASLVGDLDPGRYVSLTCRDTGCGMSPDVLDQAVEPFFTTRQEGTGLGLTSVYNITRQAGGHLEISSDVDAGTSVSIVLPVVDRPVGSRSDDDVDGEAHGATLLLVEDDDEVRPLLARALIRLGYEVVVTVSGDEAVAAAGDWGEKIDLVLTDVLMPGMTGAELVERLRQERPHLRALFMSGYASDELARRGVDDAALFVQKPFQVRALADRIAVALSQPSSVPAPGEQSPSTT
jgi:PAS domain S-box-containing protein